jgi:hypothetical protein
VAVLGAPLESAEDEEVESALQDVEFVRGDHVVGILPLVWGRLATCGGLAIRLALISELLTGRLPIGRRLPTCPTDLPSICRLELRG